MSLKRLKKWVVPLGAVAVSASLATVIIWTAPAGASKITPKTVTITTVAGKAEFQPGSVAVPHSKGSCSSTNYSLAIVNDTSVKQQLKSGLSKFHKPILPESTLYVCDPHATGTAYYGLASNKKATLTVAYG